MLNKEKESSVMQIQLLDENGYWMKHSVFLNMGDECNWVQPYLNIVCGKYPDILCTCRKVKYV